MTKLKSPRASGSVVDALGRSGVRTRPEPGQAAARPTTLQGEVLDAWGDPPLNRRRGESLGREAVTIVRLPEVPGLEMQQICHSERKWSIYHSSFDFCSSTRVTGSIEWRYRNQDCRMNPETLGVLIPGEMHRVTRLDGDADYLLLLVEPTTMARFLEDDEHHLLYSAPHQLGGKRHCMKLAELWQAMTHRARDVMQVESLMAELLLSITQLPGDRDNSKLRNESSRIVRDFLRDNYHRNVTLDECAKLTGTSKFHLHRSFVAELGIPPHQYLSAIRISRARDLLRSGSRPADVAGLTGFCDQSHLTRVFTEVVGVTPGAYAGHCTAPERSQPDLGALLQRG